MWRIYGGSSGVAIRTRYSTLRQALPETVCIGQVEYYDPSSATMPVGQPRHCSMNKRHFFQHEHECRIVRVLPVKTAPGNPRWVERSHTKYPRGERVGLDLTTAVESITVSPLAPEWYNDCVAAVVKQFPPWLKIVPSAMLP